MRHAGLTDWDDARSPIRETARDSAAGARCTGAREQPGEGGGLYRDSARRRELLPKSPVWPMTMMVMMMGLLATSLSLAHAAPWEKPGYPTFADMGGKPYTVSYDKRALQIAGEPALFVSGAIHPPRGTPEMWGGWFEHAKANNLNMVQVYIFWK